MSVKQGGTADYIKIYNLCPWMKYPGIEVFYFARSKGRCKNKTGIADRIYAIR